MFYTEWQSRHGLSADDFQAAFDELNGDGYRVARLCVYERNNEAHYAAIWHKRGGNDFEVHHGMTRDEYIAKFNDLNSRNLRPTHISAANVNGTVVFAGVWERQPGLQWEMRFSESPREYQELFNRLSGEGSRLRCVTVFEQDGSERYASIWDQYAGPEWQAFTGMSPDEFQTKFNELQQQEFRLIRNVPYLIGGEVAYAAIWEKSQGHGWLAFHGQDENNYQTVFDQMTQAGYRLVEVSASGGDSNVFTAIWELVDAFNPVAGDMSSVLIPFMQKWTIPALSIAIAKDGYTRATRTFGYANPLTREIVNPESRYRIASISKPITSVVILRLIEQGSLSLDSTVFGQNGILGTSYGTPPYSAGYTNITVRHLLEHTSGGWANDGNDPMFQQPDLTADQLITWVIDNRTLDNTPGTNYAYSNFGYCVLGRIIEKVSGVTYFEHVRDSLLNPTGATGMAISGNTALDRAANEVTYWGENNDGESPYGMKVSRMDAHGGWIATVGDLLHFALSVDGLALPPDLLNATSLASMKTVTLGGSTYAKGWEVDGAGNLSHTGSLPGTQTQLRLQSDGTIIAALCSTRSANFSWDEFTTTIQAAAAMI